MEVDVERRVGAAPEGGFHVRGRGAVLRPGVVDGVGGGFAGEGDGGGGEGAVEDVGLEWKKGGGLDRGVEKGMNVKKKKKKKTVGRKGMKQGQAEDEMK